MMRGSTVLVWALAVCAATTASAAWSDEGSVTLIRADGKRVSLSDGIRRPAGISAVCLSAQGKTANADRYSGDPNNSVVVLDIGAGNALTGLAADFSLTANAPSLLSQSALQFSSTDLADPDSIGLAFTTTNTSGTEAFSSGGVILFSDLALGNVPAGADGLLRIEWWETLDNPEVNPDSRWDELPAPAVCSGLHLSCTDQPACDAAVAAYNVSTRNLPALNGWAIGFLIAGVGMLALRSRRRPAAGANAK